MLIYSRTALAADSDGNLTKLTTAGPHQDELRISNPDGNALLESIYNQLKVLNFQMATLTENSINEIGD